MENKPPKSPGDHKHGESALDPLGIPHTDVPDPDIIALGPEMAVAEADVRSAEEDAFVRGSSLWRDAWHRLLKNKLAVF